MICNEKQGWFIMKKLYCDTAVLMERLHRLFLEVIKLTLDQKQIMDINGVQCIILYNIGQSKLTVSEITNRGYYLGSNVTYNLKKMIENGYITQEQSQHDKRSSHVWLSDKGQDLFKHMDELFATHIENMNHNGISEIKLKEFFQTATKLESFWSFSLMRHL